MAKSKCPLCGKVLKGGEWMLRANNGSVQKICSDTRGCQMRKKLKGD